MALSIEDEDALPSTDDFIERLRAIQERVAALPILSTLTSEELLGYDENGLPT